MEDYGKYSKYVLVGHQMAEQAIPVIDKALGEISFSHDEGPFVVCDYATADGGTSMALMRHIIDWVQEKYGAEQQVHIIYEDKEDNDFKSLMLRIYGYIPDPPSYLKDHKNVFVTFCGTNYYSQCLPDNSVHLGFSSTAMHWLSQRPCTITGGAMYSIFIEDEQEKQIFKDQAAKDWQTILLHRAKELKPGGQMVIMANGIDADGQFTGNVKRVRNSFLERVQYHWQTMMQEGLLSQKEFEAIHFNYYFRTKEEFIAPFEDTASVVSKAGLKLCSAETRVTLCPYNLRWLDQGNDGDVVASRKHACDFAAGTKPWSLNIYMAALCSRPKADAKAVVEEFYRRFINEITQDPGEHALDHVYIRLRFAKNK